MHKKLLEAALFISNRPLGLDELAKLMGLNSLGLVKQILEELQKDYEKRGMEIVNTPEGWTMQVKQEFLPKIAHLTPYHDLSEGTKRTLALIVYKEPIKQSEIIKTQGNKAYSYIKELVRKGLVRTEKDGRTKIVYLTPEFERYFGEEREKIRQKMDMEIQAKQRELQKNQIQNIEDKPDVESIKENDESEQTKSMEKEKNKSEQIENIETKPEQTENAEVKNSPTKAIGEINFEELKKRSKAS